jgi:hypothetical protein
MIFRTSCVVTVLAASCVLMGCSSDDGKPSGSGAGNGTGGGNGGGGAVPAASDSDASAPAEAGAAKKGFTEACTTDVDCASGLCYQTDKGDKYCSIKCTLATATEVCVAPLSGTCNNKGFCKKP